MSNFAAASPDDDDQPVTSANPAVGAATSGARERSRAAVHGHVRAPSARGSEDGAGLSARVFGVIGVSLGTHMALMGMLGFMPAPSIDDSPKQVEMEIAEPPPPPPPAPEPEPEPEPQAKEPEPAPPPPKLKLAPKPAAPKVAEPPPPTSEPPKAAAEAPVDLTGTTLTGDAAGWSSVTGNGQAMTGPQARIGRVTGRDRSGAADGAVGATGTGPALVGEASLSRSPQPPDGMEGLLEQFFPPRARAQGVSGTAVLRVRIQPDGRATDMKVLRETGDYGFGAACNKALRQKRWQAPLDKRGQPVATEIRYTCEFEVSY